MTSAFSWQNSISLCPFNSVFQGQIFLLLQVFLDFLLLHSSPLEWKGHLFWVLVLQGLVGLHRTIQGQLLSITGWGIDLDYCDIEWFVWEMNRDHSVVFEIALKYCILDSFVDHDGYSISCKGFLLTVVDIMIIWAKWNIYGEVSQSCPTLNDPLDYSPPGSSVNGIFQARVLEWGAIAFSGNWD